MENQLEHVGVGPIPALGPIKGPGRQAVVCNVRAEIAVDGLVKVVGQQINVETRWEVSDVDPTAITLFGFTHWVNGRIPWKRRRRTTTFTAMERTQEGEEDYLFGFTTICVQ